MKLGSREEDTHGGAASRALLGFLSIPSCRAFSRIPLCLRMGHLGEPAPALGSCAGSRFLAGHRSGTPRRYGTATDTCQNIPVSMALHFRSVQTMKAGTCSSLPRLAFGTPGSFDTHVT